MKCTNLVVGLSFMTMLLCLGIPNASAIPNSITISGFLTDSDNNPVTGNFSSQVDFYADQTTTTIIATVTTTTLTVSEGVFSFILVLPKPLVIMSQAWYSLAIDTDQNGLDPSDLFGNRFQITSVPYALSAQPTNYYLPYPPTSETWNPTSNELLLTPFSTPPGGVEFTKISINAYNNGPEPQTFSIGVYDSSGHSVCISQPIILPICKYNDSYDVVEIPISGILQPSSNYFMGLGSTYGEFQEGDQGCVVVSGSYIPPIIGGGCGVINNVVINGIVPASFNPSNYIAITDAFPDVQICPLTMAFIKE